jgi:hypothetical protein
MSEPKMDASPGLYWHNFDSGEMELVSPDFPDDASDEAVMRYLPVYKGMTGGGPARGLYRCLRAMGKTKRDALTDTLRAAVGGEP